MPSPLFFLVLVFNNCSAFIPSPSTACPDVETQLTLCWVTLHESVYGYFIDFPKTQDLRQLPKFISYWSIHRKREEEVGSRGRRELPSFFIEFHRNSDTATIHTQNRFRFRFAVKLDPMEAFCCRSK